MRRAIVKHLEEHSLLPTGQHGFRALRSTLTQLLTYWDDILEELQQGGGVDCVYLDFSKAFDKVETGVLLHKLRDLEIRGKVGCWLAAFLDPNRRSKAIAVDKQMSKLSSVISGVPQGTVLGPVLFLIHIADIAKDVSNETNTSSFADDTRARRSITDPVRDCAALQNDLETIYKWAERVNMKFNSDKFECLRFWPGRMGAPEQQYYGPDSQIIENKQHLRDLGVEICEDLSFSVHIQNVISSSSKLDGWAMRTFRKRSQHVMITIWKSIIQPKIDYCSQLWSPNDQASINQIENVQRHFISKIEGVQHLSYWEKLKHLHLYSQERRRERYQVIFLWQVSQNLVQGYDIQFFTDERRGRMIRPKQVSWHAPAQIRRAREASMAVKGAHIFNLLPKEIRNLKANSSITDKISEFKTKLDKFLSNIPDQQQHQAVGGLLKQTAYSIKFPISIPPEIDNQIAEQSCFLWD